MPKRTSIVCAAAVLLGLSWSQASIAQENCGDIEFIDQINDRFPEAEDACLGIVEQDGRQYAHFEARLVSVRGNNVEAEFKLPDGTYGRRITFTPPPDARVRIGGQSYRYRDLSAGQDLDVYLPPDRWEIGVHDDPAADFATASSVTTVPLSEPSQQVATLPATASRLPSLVVLGLMFLGFGAILAGVPRRL